MAWTTKKGINLRSTLAFVTDPAGTVALPGDPTQATNNPTYTPGSTSRSPLSLDSDSFNCGWLTGGTDGARDRAAGVDARLAGRDGPLSGTNTLQLQCGTAPGNYKIWLGFTDQTNGTGVTISCTISDANGTLTTVTSAALTANQVTGADGTIYATAAAWAGTADTSGVSITVTTTDTTNGNGGPLLKFLCANGTPLAFVGVQFVQSGPSPIPSSTLMAQVMT